MTSDAEQPQLKRKRSLYDTPVDPNVVQQALISVRALQEELDEVDETSDIMQSIMERLQLLETILGKAKKPKRGFSSVTKVDLKNLGVQRRRLEFDSVQLGKLVNENRTASEGQISSYALGWRESTGTFP
ncbi:hypothetical protein DFH06DRAFT_1337977 [Mycena polygramma]|nr:hypothetical protein DFH06DRAFT_1337977 [Mycena polygramma]